MDEIYSSLPMSTKGEVRLITMEPGQRGDPIVVSMRVASLDDVNTRFDGLSYTWGDPSDYDFITCNGASFRATRNLWSALQRLRVNKRYTFWIDAICINQNDVVERANQVKQMTRIYSMARPVWIDLGDSIPQFERVFSLIQKLFTVFQTFDDEEHNTTPIAYTDFEKLGLPPYDDEAWVRWSEMLARPYFTRLWVVSVFARKL